MTAKLIFVYKVAIRGGLCNVLMSDLGGLKGVRHSSSDRSLKSTIDIYSGQGITDSLRARQVLEDAGAARCVFLRCTCPFRVRAIDDPHPPCSEVERARKLLEQTCVGRTIKEVIVREDTIVFVGGQGAHEKFKSEVEGRKVEGAARKGKV